MPDISGMTADEAKQNLIGLGQDPHQILVETISGSLELELYVHVDRSGADRQMSLASFFKFTRPWTDVVPAVFTSDDPGAGHMHAKCVVVDERATLITSVNFTAAAQHSNVELGVLVNDAEFGRLVAGQWRSLATQGVFGRVTK